MLAGAELVVHLIFVGHVVDEAGTQGVFRQKRTLVENPADVGFGLLPPVGDAAHDLLEQIAVHRLVHLPVRGRVALFLEGVDGGLVVADAMQIRIGADLVEGAAEEQLVGRDADQIQRRRRHQEDSVGGRRQIVLTVAAVLDIGVDRLARLLEIEDCVADLLHLGPEGRIEPGRLQQHRADARVDLGLPKVVHD